MVPFTKVQLREGEQIWRGENCLVSDFLGLTCFLAIQRRWLIGIKKWEPGIQKEITGRDRNLEVTGIMIIYEDSI